MSFYPIQTSEICKYCGTRAQFISKTGIYCCKKSPNSCPGKKQKFLEWLDKPSNDGRLNREIRGDLTSKAMKISWRQDKEFIAVIMI